MRSETDAGLTAELWEHRDKEPGKLRTTLPVGVFLCARRYVHLECESYVGHLKGSRVRFVWRILTSTGGVIEERKVRSVRVASAAEAARHGDAFPAGDALACDYPSVITYALRTTYQDFLRRLELASPPTWRSRA